MKFLLITVLSLLSFTHLASAGENSCSQVLAAPTQLSPSITGGSQPQQLEWIRLPVFVDLNTIAYLHSLSRAQLISTIQEVFGVLVIQDTDFKEQPNQPVDEVKNLYIKTYFSENYLGLFLPANESRNKSLPANNLLADRNIIMIRNTANNAEILHEFIHYIVSVHIKSTAQDKLLPLHDRYSAYSKLKLLSQELGNIISNQPQNIDLQASTAIQIVFYSLENQRVHFTEELAINQFLLTNRKLLGLNETTDLGKIYVAHIRNYKSFLEELRIEKQKLTGLLAESLRFLSPKTVAYAERLIILTNRHINEVEQARVDFITRYHNR